MPELPAASPASTEFSADLLSAQLTVSLTAMCVLRSVREAGEVVDFTLEYLNPAAQHLLGVPEGNQLRLLARFPHARANGLFGFCCRVFASDQAGRFEVNYQADGLDNYFYVAAIRHGGQLVVSFSDTAGHERSVVEEVLRQSQAREQAARRAAEASRDELRRLFEQAPVAIAVLQGPRYVIELANPAVCALWGRTPAQALHTPLFELLPEIRDQGFKELLDEAVRTGVPYVAREVPLRVHQHGLPATVHVNFVYYPLRDERGHITAVAAVATDVSEQVAARRLLQQRNEKTVSRLNQELAVANERLRASNAALEQRVAERTHALLVTLEQLERRGRELTQALAAEQELGELKSRFVTMASHEFRTPLAVVLSSATLVAEYPGTDQQAQRLTHLARIRASVRHLSDILEEFLTVGRIEEGKVEVHPATLDLAGLLADVVADLRGELKAGQTIVQQLECPHPFYLDGSLLRKILLNLLGNALKYSGENSVVTVRAYCRENQLILQVQDEGVGISEEDQAHLFERFFRARSVANVHGTGLGLYIIARYLELMGGTIALESTLHVGTTFTLSIPYGYENHSAD